MRRNDLSGVDIAMRMKLQFKRELRLVMRSPRWVFHAFLFFAIILVFFPLTLPPEPLLFRRVAAGLIWTAVLFAMSLSAGRLYLQDEEYGVITQWRVSGYPLMDYVLPKLAVHWIFNVVPLLFLCPLCGLLFGFSGYEMVILVSSLVIGTPVILLLCALAESFCIGLKNQGILSTLILFPLVIPVLILGSGLLNMAMMGAPLLGLFALFSGIALFAGVFLLPTIVFLVGRAV